MSVKEMIIRYMNLIARACAVVLSYSKGINDLCVVQDFNKTNEDMKYNIALAWLTKSSVIDFIRYVERIIDEVEKADEEERYIKALAICLWLEENITYDARSAFEERSYFSVNGLLQFDGVNKIIAIDSMNTNYEETGIQIVPKFEICRHWSDEGTIPDAVKPNPYANRDVFSGLNGKTKKVSFVNCKENFHIHNLILPFRFTPDAEAVLNIAFCPLTDQDLLKTENVQIKEHNRVYEGVKVTGVKQPEQLLKRLQDDWRHACNEGKADIVFFPEVLGSSLSEEVVQHNRDYNKTIFTIAKEESRKGNKLPILTVLPSFCKDGENKASLLDKNGFIMAKQSKYEPYFNLKNHRKEYLKPCKEKHYYVIHIPKLHRIAVLICADFLQYDTNDAKKLFSEVGCTLLLVPSYSHGEMDFVNTIQTLKPYGTTVIWGNSCGAVKDKRVVGGCCVAGFDTVKKFSDCCDCGSGCSDNEKCVFVVSVPLRLAGADQAEVADITVKRI